MNRIAMFENDPRVVRDYRKILKSQKIEIARVATNMQEGWELIPRLVEFGIMVVTIDGKLDESSPLNNDGDLLCHGIHELRSGIIVVGNPSEGKIEGADYNAVKEDLGKLCLVLTNAFARLNR